MRSEFREYYAENPKKKSFFGELKFKVKYNRFLRKFKKLKLGSEDWHEMQNRVSMLSATTNDCKIRSAFYETTMGENCKGAFYCLQGVTLNFPKRIKIGYNLFLNRGVNIVARADIEIGDNVIIGPHTVINSGSHNYAGRDKLIRDQGHKKLPIVIKNNVFIGGNVFVLPGVTIGEGAVVGAGSIVTKSVEPYTVVAGVPAKVIKRIE